MGVIALIDVPGELVAGLDSSMRDTPGLSYQAYAARVALERELGPMRDDVDAILIGPRVEDPIQAVQRAHQLDPNISVIVMGDGAQCARIDVALRLAPFVGVDVRCGDVGRVGLGDLVRSAAERTRLRRSHQKTLTALNRQLDLQRDSSVPRGERYLSQLLDTVPMGIVALDPARRILSANREAARLLELSERELLGRDLVDHAPHFAGSAWAKVLDEATSTAGPSILESRQRDQWFEVRAVRLGEGGAEGCLVVFQDVTARVRAEQARDASHAHAEQVALERAKLFVKEQAARQKLEGIAEMAAVLSKALTQSEVARIVVERGMQIMGADTCTLYALDDGTGSLELIADAGVDARVLERIRRIDAGSDNPAFATIQTGRSLWVQNEGEYARLFPRLAKLDTSGRRAQAFWSVPLIVEGAAIGLLGMGFYGPRHFPAEQRAFVESFASQCGQALRRAQRLESESKARDVAETARQWLQTTLRSIGDAVIATDAAGAVVFMNPVAEQLTGWSVEEARGAPLSRVFRIVNEHTRAEVESPVERVLREGVVVGLANHTVLLGKQPGHETPIDDSGAPIRDESGAITGVVLVFRDVTDKKHEELRRELLAEATATLSESLDYQGTLAALSELLVPRYCDWVAIEMRGDDDAQEPHRVIRHADPRKVELALELRTRFPTDPSGAHGAARAWRTGETEFIPRITDELLVELATGEEHLRCLRELDLRSVVTVPLTARGAILGTITLVHAESGREFTRDDAAFIEELGRRAAIAIDNAALYAAEQQARHAADVANRAKDEFLATVSHELRTPLNAIVGWANILSSGGDAYANRAVRGLEAIERNAVAMAQLIEDLLDVSRIVSGKLRLDMESVSLADVIEQAIESVKPASGARDIKIEPSLETGIGPVHGDAGRLQQVFWNLLSNAVKFTPEGGTVRVSLCRRGGWVEIEVVDSGKGIDPDFLPHVFEPFRQADGTFARAHAGLGLGLAIVRQLVELHGGRAEVQSEGLGRGATFSVRLPLASERAAHAPAEPVGAPEPVSADASAQRAPLAGVRILAVDDDEDARQLLKEALEHWGAQVMLAESAAEAMQTFAHTVPDVLLSDIGMPGEDGIALIRKVRQLPVARGGGIPAAALTAYTRAEDRRNVLGAGYTMHIAKPIHLGELLVAISTLARSILQEPRSNAVERSS